MSVRHSKCNMQNYSEFSLFFFLQSNVPYIFVCPPGTAHPPTFILLLRSHPYSLFHPVIPGLVVRPTGRLRGILGERAVGRLCRHRARHFPQPALNGAEPWPHWALTLKIYVKPNSASQTLFKARLSIGGEKNLTHLNCSRCPPFVCWSSRVGRLAATS